MSGVLDYRKIDEADAVKTLRIFIERAGTPEPEGSLNPDGTPIQAFQAYLDGQSYDRTPYGCEPAPFEVWHQEQEDMNRPEQSLQGWFGLWVMHYAQRDPNGAKYYRICSQMVRIPLFCYDEVADMWAELDQNPDGSFKLGAFDEEIDNNIRAEIRRHYDLLSPAFGLITGKLAEEITQHFDQSPVPLPAGKRASFLQPVDTVKVSLDDMMMIVNGGFVELAVVASEMKQK